MSDAGADSRELDPLTPYLAPKLAEAAAAFVDALRPWLGVDERWVITPSRRYTAGTKAPSHVDVRGPGGSLLSLRLHTSGDVPGWTAGPLTFTVARLEGVVPPDQDRNLKPILRHLVGLIQGTDVAELALKAKALAKLHKTWATLASMDDRMFRHLERAHSGFAGLLRTGFTCNQDCHFCPEGRDWPNPPDELVFQWLDEIAAAGAQRLNVCGGEPTLWRHLPDLIRRATTVHGLSVHMNTNAIKLRVPTFTASLKEAGLKSVLISLHAVDEALSDSITRSPGTHRRTVEGIHAALDAGLFVILNCCVDTANVHHLPEHARFVREQFVEKHPDNPVRMVNYSQPGKYYNFDEYKRRLVDLEAARPMLTAAARTLDEVGVLLEIAGTCGFPSCVVRDIADLVPWRPKDTMDADHRRSRADDPEVCRGCAAREQCIGPRREYLEVHGTRGLKPFEALPTSDWYARLSKLPVGDAWTIGLDDGPPE